jgi:hypothetical protein
MTMTDKFTTHKIQQDIPIMNSVRGHNNKYYQILFIIKASCFIFIYLYIYKTVNNNRKCDLRRLNK